MDGHPTNESTGFFSPPRVACESRFPAAAARCLFRNVSEPIHGNFVSPESLRNKTGDAKTAIKSMAGFMFACIFLIPMLVACGGGGGGGSAGISSDSSPPDNMPDPADMSGSQGAPDSTDMSGSQGTPGPSGTSSPVSQTSLAKQPSLSAKGVTVSIAHNNAVPTFVVNKDGHLWTREGFKYFPGGAGNGDWTNSTTRLNADAIQRFRVTTDITGSSDMDYIAYGYWSRHPSTSLYHGDFESFYYGSMPYAGNVKDLGEVTATYVGNAMGVYTIKYTLGSLRTYGYFEAQVNLTASFGPDGKIAGNMTGIRNIEELYLNDHDPLSGYGDEVKLSANYDSSGRSFVGDDGDGCGTAGCEWGGYFLGPSHKTVGNEEILQVPTGAAGWFEGLTIQQLGCSSLICGMAKLDGSFGAQRK